MTVGSMIPYWNDWASQFHPRIVVIYASPLFYLSNSFKARTRSARQPNQSPKPSASRTEPAAYGFESRFLARLKDAIEVPQFIQSWRQERWIAAQVDGKPDGWFFRTAPEERLALFISDLETLTESIRAHGAEPVLVTHALRAMSPPRPEDIEDLHPLRVFLPRATEEAFIAFNGEANRSIQVFGSRRDVAIIDVAESMNGRRDLFADIVHFNDRGASLIAELISEQIRTKVPPPSTKKPVDDVAVTANED